MQLNLIDGVSVQACALLVKVHIYLNILFLCVAPADPRVQDWSMMESPLPTMAMCAFYAYFSKSLGPKLMANRKPMDLRLVLVLYNLFQTVFSAWIFYEVCMCSVMLYGACREYAVVVETISSII